MRASYIAYYIGSRDQILRTDKLTASARSYGKDYINSIAAKIERLFMQIFLKMRIYFFFKKVSSLSLPDDFIKWYLF